MVDVLAQVLPTHVVSAYRSGFDRAEGFVVDGVDVSFATTADDVLDAFGITAAAAAYLDETRSVHVLRMPASPFDRLARAVGLELARPGSPSIVEPPPFTGNAFPPAASMSFRCGGWPAAG